MNEKRENNQITISKKRIKDLIIATSFLLLLLVSLYSSLSYGQLLIERNTLRDEHAALQKEYYLLKASYDDLKSDYSYLKESYDELQEDYLYLKNEYDILQENYSSMEISYSELKTKYLYLRSNYSYLDENYSKLQRDYLYLKGSYEALYTPNKKITDWYNYIVNQINLRQGLYKDRMKFISPYDPEVNSLVIQVTGGWSDTSDWNEFWSDMREMYNWITNNVRYTRDPLFPLMPPIIGSLQWRADYWRSPNETIKDKTGDCEDQAVLLTSMILNYGEEKYRVWAIGWTSSISGHVAVAIPVKGGKLTILDPAGKFYTKDESGDLSSKDVRTAIYEWLQYWENEGGEDLYVRYIFSRKIYETFSSTEEAIDWIIGR